MALKSNTHSTTVPVAVSHFQFIHDSTSEVVEARPVDPNGGRDDRRMLVHDAAAEASLLRSLHRSSVVR